MLPSFSHAAHTGRAALAVALVVLAACDAEPVVEPAAPLAVSPARAADPSRAFVASPGLRAAVSDAHARLLPTVDVALRPVLGAALGELQAALDSGQVLRSQRAVAALQAALATARPVEVGSPEQSDSTPKAAANADLGAIEMLAAAVEGEVRPAPSPAPAPTPAP